MMEYKFGINNADMRGGGRVAIKRGESRIFFGKVDAR